MHADLVSTAVGLCDLDEGEKGVLGAPFSSCCCAWEHYGDIDELWFIDFDFLSQTKAEQGLLVLKNSYQVQIENHLCLYILEKTCENVFFLRSWQVSLERHLVKWEIQKGSMTLPYGLIALTLPEESGSEVGLNEGKQIGFPKLPLAFAINSCHAIWFDYKPS